MATAERDPHFRASAAEALGDGWQEIVDCPVCYMLLTKPKVLQCGHCICQNCETRMNENMRISCPSCRKMTDVEADGLPTNFVLQNLIDHCQRKMDLVTGLHKFTCSACDDKLQDKETIICQTCSDVFLCGMCTLKMHKDHQTVHVVDVVQQRRTQVANWKKAVESRFNAVIGEKSAVAKAAETSGKVDDMAMFMNISLKRWIDKQTQQLEKDTQQYKGKYDELEAQVVENIVDSTVDVTPLLQEEQKNLDTIEERSEKLLAESADILRVMDDFKQMVIKMGAPAVANAFDMDEDIDIEDLDVYRGTPYPRPAPDQFPVEVDVEELDEQEFDDSSTIVYNNSQFDDSWGGFGRGYLRRGAHAQAQSAHQFGGFGDGQSTSQGRGNRGRGTSINDPPLFVPISPNWRDTPPTGRNTGRRSGFGVVDGETAVFGGGFSGRGGSPGGGWRGVERRGARGPGYADRPRLRASRRGGGHGFGAPQNDHAGF